MAFREEKTVGIIGGMGPEATVDLMQRIIRLTPALDDVDHIHCIVNNDPKIPSRIKAIIDGTGEDPGPYLAGMAQKLETLGADVLAMPCNTAHYYYDAIQEAVRIPLLHMIDAVVEEIRQAFPNSTKVGILGSPAVKITGIYEKKFAPVNIEPVFPDPDFQEILFKIIKTIKAGKHDAATTQSYKNVCNHLENKGCDLSVVACTELSALNCCAQLPTLDAAQVLAKKIVAVVKDDNY